MKIIRKGFCLLLVCSLLLAPVGVFADTAEGQEQNQPAQSQPVNAGQNGTTDQGNDAGQGSTADPGDSGQTDPGQDTPSQGDSSQTNPSQGNPGQGDSGQTNPSQDNPGQTDPGQTDPGSEDPGQEEPQKPDPVILLRDLQLSGTNQVKYVTDAKGNRLNLYELAGQKQGEYAVIQGATSDDTYIYFILWNKEVDKCKIVKMNLEKQKIVKVSAPLSVYHGNEMVYSPDAKKLYVAHCHGSGKTITEVDPTTLKVTKKIKVAIPSKLKGISQQKLKEVQDFSAISYNKNTKEFILKIMGTRNYFVTDKNFKILRYIGVKKGVSSGITQGFLQVGDGLYQIHSNANYLRRYDEAGVLKGTYRINAGEELESIFMHKGKVYGVLYHTFLKTHTKTVKKTVTVKKKVKVKVKVKVKTKKKNRKGKPIYKYKYKYKYKWKKVKTTKKEKVEYQKKYQRNYLLEITTAKIRTTSK